MQLQPEIEDLGLSPSFNCYFLDSLTAVAAAKVSREFKQEQAAQFHQFTDVDEDDFEFSLELSDAEISHRQIDLHHRQFVSPVLDSQLLSQGELDLKVEEIDHAASVNVQIQKFYVDDQDESMSSSSSDADEFGGKRSGFLCMWMQNSKANDVSSSVTECRKSSSTGSRSHGSRRWRIYNFLRRSSSDGEETMLFLRSKKIDSAKDKLNVNSGDVAKVTGESSVASSPSFHELFFVQKRAQQKREKMKSFLPYRQDLLGLFVNINRIRRQKSVSPF